MPRLELEEGADLPDWRWIAERKDGKLSVRHEPIIEVQTNGYKPLPSIKARGYTNVKRDPAHDHENEPGDTPVIICDLNGTLTPAPGFPLSEPFPNVKESLDFLVAGGCCIHIATAAMGPQHPEDIIAARLTRVAGWCIEWGIPVSFITGKVSSHVFYDDRMVSASPVPGIGGGGRLWPEILDGICSLLDARFDKDDAGLWRRKDIPEVGTEITAFPPDGTILPDTPRAISSPAIDIDMHRCMTQASSSTNLAQPSPGAVDAVRTIYGMGYFVRFSCQGWDPSTHDPDESIARLAGMQQWLRDNGIPYDEMVAKDHGDVFVDDKGVLMTDFQADLPVLLKAMATPANDDEVTAQYGADERLTPAFVRD